MITNIQWKSHDLVVKGERVQGFTLQVKVLDGKEISDWQDVSAMDRFRGPVTPFMLGVIDVEELT